MSPHQATVRRRRFEVPSQMIICRGGALSTIVVRTRRRPDLRSKPSSRMIRATHFGLTSKPCLRQPVRHPWHPVGLPGSSAQFGWIVVDAGQWCFERCAAMHLAESAVGDEPAAGEEVIDQLAAAAVDAAEARGVRDHRCEVPHPLPVASVGARSRPFRFRCPVDR